MRYLKTTKNIGDQVTRYQLEANRLERQGKSFDFFKYTSRGKVREEDGLSEVSSKDYDFIPDFHPFLTSPKKPTGSKRTSNLLWWQNETDR